MVNPIPQGKSAITGAQVRAARAAAGLTLQQLADLSGLGFQTIRRAEAANGPVSMTRVNTERLIAVLEKLGITFLVDDGNGSGVRIRPR